MTREREIRCQLSDVVLGVIDRFRSGMRTEAEVPGFYDTLIVVPDDTGEGDPGYKVILDIQRHARDFPYYGSPLVRPGIHQNRELRMDLLSTFDLGDFYDCRNLEGTFLEVTVSMCHRPYDPGFMPVGSGFLNIVYDIGTSEVDYGSGFTPDTAELRGMLDNFDGFVAVAAGLRTL